MIKTGRIYFFINVKIWLLLFKRVKKVINSLLNLKLTLKDFINTHICNIDWIE